MNAPHGGDSRFQIRTDPDTGEIFVEVYLRGEGLLDEPYLNKGTCFTLEERDRLGLAGLVPAGVFTPEQQVARAYENYRKVQEDVDRYLFLSSVQDSNETLFYRLLSEHLEEMVPIVYTPTVGQVCEKYSQLFRRPRGIYLTLRDRGRVRQILEASASPHSRVLVVTDNEAILGLGDLGVGGMPIAVGKLALYTIGAGLHPATCLPIDLDVGTDNRRLLDDPLYLGARHERVRGEEYWLLLDELVDAVRAVFPDALIQWEDFSYRNAFRLLQRHRERMLSFNDDVQGTGAIVVAGILAAMAHTGRRLEEERVLFFGAGASGGGCALAVRAAMRARGVAEEKLSSHVLALDSRGLVAHGRDDLDPPKDEIAAPLSQFASWTVADRGRVAFLEVVRNFRPTILIGTSGQQGAFTEEIVRAMQEGCERPVILPLSNPTTKAEATPAQLLEWTNGAALVGSGSPFARVRHGGKLRRIGQGNNVFAFPGVGLGAVAAGARHLPDEAFVAAAEAIAEHTAGGEEPEALFPPLQELRAVSGKVARRVAQTLVEVGAAPHRPAVELDARIEGLRWRPNYLPYREGGRVRPGLGVRGG